MGKTDMAVFESMPVSNALLSLALPTVLGQVMIVLYNMADTFFIGQTNNNAMISAVTLCMPAFMFISAIANLFGVGGSSVISRALGKNNTDRARYACAFSVWGCIIMSLLYSALVFIFIDPFVDFLGGASPEVHALSAEYIKWTVVIGGLSTSLASLFGHIVRSEGSSIHASIGVILGGVLNIVLDPLFMFVILEPGNEVLGAAYATALSNLISFLYFILLALSAGKRGSIIYLKLTKHSFEREIPKKIMIAGVPAFTMTFAENLSYSILDNLLSSYGTAVQAGIGVAKKINMLAHSIVRGITQGALPYLGYNYSAGKRIKTKKIVLTTIMFAVGMAVICTAVMFLSAHMLIGIFLEDGNESVDYGIRFLRILCIGGPFSALAYTLISFFQAVGHGITSFILALLRKGILDIPLMYILHNLVSMYGIVMATPVADIVCCIVSVILFLRFASNHLANNKKRKIYNKETGKYEILVEGV